MAVSRASTTNSSAYNASPPPFESALERLRLPRNRWIEFKTHKRTIEELFASPLPSLAFKGWGPYQVCRGPGQDFPPGTAAFAEDLARKAPRHALDLLEILLLGSKDTAFKARIAAACSMACDASPDVATDARARAALQKELRTCTVAHAETGSTVPASAAATGVEALHRAIWLGDVEATLALLRNDTSGRLANARLDAKGTTPPMLAARLGRLEILRHLAHAGGDLALVDSTGAGALHLAAGQGLSFIVEALLRIRPGLALRIDGRGDTALHAAAAAGDAESIHLLLEAGADPNAAGDDGLTPLHHAARGGRAAAVGALLAHAKLAPNTRADDGSTALHAAVSAGHADIVKALAKHAAVEVNAVNGNKETPLHVAARLGRVDAFEALLEQPRIDVNAQAQYLELPGHAYEVRADGYTPLGYAIVHSKKTHSSATALERISKALLARKDLDLTRTNAFGESALHIAASHGASHVVNGILDSVPSAQAHGLAGAKDKWGVRPYSLAIESGMKDETIARLMKLTTITPAAGCPPDGKGKHRTHVILGHGYPGFPAGKVASRIRAGGSIPEFTGDGIRDLTFEELKKLARTSGGKVKLLLHGNSIAIHGRTAGELGDKEEAPMVEIIRLLCAAGFDDIKVWGCKMSLSGKPLERRMNLDPEWPRPHPRRLVLATGNQSSRMAWAYRDALHDIEDDAPAKTGARGTKSEELTVTGSLEMRSDPVTGQIAFQRLHRPKTLAASVNRKQAARVRLFLQGKRGDRMNLEKLKLLVEGAPSAKRGATANVALLHAVDSGWAEGVSYLLDHASLSSLGGATNVLCRACKAGDANVVEAILAKLPGSFSSKAFYWACRNGHAEIVKSMLAKFEPDPNQANDKNWSPLAAACANGHKDVVVALIEAGGSDAAKLDRRGLAPLHHAASGGHTSIARYLMARCNLPADLKSRGGKTAQQMASAKGHSGTANMLARYATTHSPR